MTRCVPVSRPMENLVVLPVQLTHCQGGGEGDQAHHDPLHKDRRDRAWHKGEKGRQCDGLAHSLHFLKSQLRLLSPPPHLNESETS